MWNFLNFLKDFLVWVEIFGPNFLKIFVPITREFPEVFETPPTFISSPFQIGDIAKKPRKSVFFGTPCINILLFVTRGVGVKEGLTNVRHLFLFWRLFFQLYMQNGIYLKSPEFHTRDSQYEGDPDGVSGDGISLASDQPRSGVNI